MAISQDWNIRDIKSDGPPLAVEHAQTKEAAIKIFIFRYPQYASNVADLIAEAKL